MKKEVITVIGSTGSIGSELVRLLSEKNRTVRAVMRNFKRIQDLPFVHWIKADVADERLLNGVLAGTDRLFILTGNNPGFSKTQNKIIEKAKEESVKHIVKLSALGASPHTKTALSKEHYEVEQTLKKSGIPFTILRPHAFMQNWLGEVATTVKAENKIYAAIADGRVPYIDARDIAAVAAEALLNPDEHKNKYYVLTGGKAVSYYDLADAISKAIDEKVTYEDLSMEAMRERMEKQGINAKKIDSFLSLADYQKAGGPTERTSDDVENILKRKPYTINDFAENYKEYFKK